MCNPLANSTVGTIFGNFGFNLNTSGFSYTGSGSTTGMWYAIGY